MNPDPTNRKVFQRPNEVPVPSVRLYFKSWMFLSKQSRRMILSTCLWIRNERKESLTMCTWQPVRISFFASTMGEWRNICLRSQNNHPINTFILDQRISVVLFQCSKSYIKLFTWNHQFSIDFLFAGLVMVNGFLVTLLYHIRWGVICFW